jgi:hypothetical protein
MMRGSSLQKRHSIPIGHLAGNGESMVGHNPKVEGVTNATHRSDVFVNISAK